MIAFLSSEENHESMSEALKDTKIIYKKIGEFSWRDLEIFIKEIRNMDEVDLLILDSKITQDSSDIEKAIRNYRLVREDERIIVLINDTNLAESLAEYRVYDFVFLNK